jgi:hypothetical protein
MHGLDFEKRASAIGLKVDELLGDMTVTLTA